jgi:hypothetical protein
LSSDTENLETHGTNKNPFEDMFKILFLVVGTMSLLLLAANIAITPLANPHADKTIDPETKERYSYSYLLLFLVFCPFIFLACRNF